MYSPVLENRKTTDIPHSALPPPQIHHKTSPNNRNNQNDSRMFNVYKVVVYVSVVVYFRCVTISWWVGIEPTSGH